MGVWDSSDFVTQSFAKDSSVGVEIKGCNGARKMEMMSSSWIRGDLIGAGAFGKVNLALNRKTGELFAVKSIECNERNTSEMQAMKNEVEILSSLDSPHVVKCLGSSYSVENGKSMHNVFVEYMSGGSLADLMKKFGGHFDEPLIRNYTRSILEGIHYLHEQEIVHCDIKGKNVLVGSSGVKLADFGAAKRMSESNVVDSQLTMKGTPLWMAPEVVSLAEQGPASDIWSLGCTVLEMATGKAPWIHIANGAANPFVALYHIHRSEELPKLPSCLSEEAHDFLRKCFQRDPRVRSTAEELLQHPFITQSFSVQEECKSQAPETSPTSTLDFSTQQHDTSGGFNSIVNSVPILRSPLSFFKRSPMAVPLAPSNFQSEEPKQQSNSTSSSSPDWWCNSPLSPVPGQWIVVRSPKATSPTSCEAPKLPHEERQEEEAVAVKECNLPVIAQEEVAVEPEFAACATDSFQEQLSKERKTFCEACLSREEDSHSVQICDVVMVEECEAPSASSSSDDDDDIDNEESQMQDNARLTMSIANICSSVGEDRFIDFETLTRRFSSIKSIFHMGRMPRSIIHDLVSNLRPPATLSTRLQTVKSASLKSRLRKLAKVQFKRTSRGHRGRPPRLLRRFSSRTEVRQSMFQKLSTLGRSLYSFFSSRTRLPSAVATYLENTFGSIEPQLRRNRLFLNKSTIPWLLYQISDHFISVLLLGFVFCD